MHKTLFSLLIISGCSLHSFSQEDPLKYRLQLNAGAGHNIRQDRIFSPMVHSDMSLVNAGLDFVAESRLYHHASLRFSSFSPMISSFDYYEDGEFKSAAPHSFILVNLFYNAGKTWSAGKGSFSAGLSLSADIQALTYVYGRISSFGYYSAIGPGAFIKYSREVTSKSRISSSLQLPLVSLYSRSPYLVNDDEFIENISSHSGIKTFLSFLGDGRLVTWNRLQYLNTRIEYDFDLSERWGIGATWIFDFVHANAPRELLSFRNSLYFTAYFRF